MGFCHAPGNSLFACARALKRLSDRLYNPRSLNKLFATRKERNANDENMNFYGFASALHVWDRKINSIENSCYASTSAEHNF